MTSSCQKVFEDKECAEVLLRAILKKKDLKVKDVHVQYDIKNLQGRSVRLDILATDESGKLYNVEVQRNNHGAVPKRAKYNSSLLDANITDAGEDYKNLAETYVIFITEGDIFGANKALYHIDRIVKETKKPFGDEAHIIIMARKTAANPDAYYLDLRVRLSVGCKRRFYFFFLYLPVFSYLRL